MNGRCRRRLALLAGGVLVGTLLWVAPAGKADDCHKVQQLVSTTTVLLGSETCEPHDPGTHTCLPLNLVVARVVVCVDTTDQRAAAWC